jgi:hypothetical protein
MFLVTNRNSKQKMRLGRFIKNKNIKRLVVAITIMVLLVLVANYLMAIK